MIFADHLEPYNSFDNLGVTLRYEAPRLYSVDTARILASRLYLDVCSAFFGIWRHSVYIRYTWRYLGRESPESDAKWSQVTNLLRRRMRCRPLMKKDSN